MKSKWQLIGVILSAVGGLAGIFGGIVASKQMEQEVDEAVQRHLNPPAESTEEES